MASTGWADPNEAEDRIRSELRATLATYQELGPSYEDQVVNSFVDRIRPALDAHPAQPMTAPVQSAVRRHGRRRDRPHFGLLLILALLFGWFVAFGGVHRVVHVSVDGGGFPFHRPGITAPVAPQPLAPGSSVQ